MRSLWVLLVGLLITAAASADPQVKTVSVTQGLATGGAVLHGQVTLDAPSADENLWVELRTDEFAHAPMAVRVPAGHSSVTFTVCTDPVDQDQLLVVRASIRGVGTLCQVKLKSEVAASR